MTGMDRRRFLTGLTAGSLMVGCRGTPPISDWTLRPAGARGTNDSDWLDAHYSFSFSKYKNRAYSRFRALRVMNNDIIKPGGGFRMHGHKEMEIVTWVLDGALEHKDNLGNGAIIEPGIVQRMSAGTGIRHSEFNASRTFEVELYQIWMTPDLTGEPPSYAEAPFQRELSGDLPIVASGRGVPGAISIRTDVDLYAGQLRKGAHMRWEQVPGRATWVQVARGAVTLNGQRLTAGDGAHTESAGLLELRADEASELLMFDLA